MTRNKQSDRDAQEAAQRRFADLVRNRIDELHRQRETLGAVIDELDRKAQALATVDANMKIAHHVAVAETLRIIDAELLLTALDAVSETGGESLHARAFKTLVIAVDHGLGLGEYLECTDLDGWLKGRGIETGDGAGTTDTGSA